MLTVLALACATQFVGGASPVAAQEPGSMTFATGTPLSLNWAQLAHGHGKSLGVCNGGRATVPRFQILPTDFQFKRSGETVLPSNALSLTPRHRAVRAGECTLVYIAAKGETPLDAGEYSGTLLLVAAGGGSTRLPMTVVTAAAKPATPAGVAESMTLSFHNSTPKSRDAEAVLLLKAPAAGEGASSLGKSCDKATMNETDCPFIGNLYQDGSIMRVRVSGPARLDPDKFVQELPIRLQAFKHPVGTYEGAVVLPGASQTIKLKVNGTDSWIWATLALALGAVLALASQFWNGHIRPKMALDERKNQLKGLYGNTVPGYPGIVMSEPKLETYMGEIAQAIGRYASSVVVFDTKSDAYAAIDASLKLAEADAKVFRESGGLKRALDQLKVEADRTVEMLKQKEVSESPDILKQAIGLLVPDRLGVGEPTQRAKQAEDLKALLVDWNKLAIRVLTHAVWLKHIVGSPALETPDEADAETLAYAGPELWAVRERLFAATDATELSAMRASGAHDFVFNRIARLGAEFHIDMPAPGQAPGEFTNGKLNAIHYLAVEDGSKLSDKQVVDEHANVEAQQAQPAKLPTRNGWRLAGDLLVLLSTAVIATVAGLSTFYFGKTFGTFDDYLTVIVVGSAAQALLKAVVNQTEVLLHDISLQAPALAARVVVSPPT